MLAIALMLQVAVAPMDYSGVPALPSYQATPNPAKSDIRACAAEYDRLQKFVGNFNAYVFDHELNRGGRLEWRDANNIRYMADLASRNYLEKIRYIAWQGRVPECRALASEGIQNVTTRAVRPVFGNAISYVDIMRYRN